MQIFIRTPYGKMHTVDVDPKMTIDELKKKIAAKYQIAIRDMNITFKGTILKDATTIDEAGIKQEDTVSVVKNAEEAKSDEIDLVIAAKEGERVTMTFKRSDTVEQVISKMIEKSPLDLVGGNLFYKGEKLEKDKALEEIGVKNKDLLAFIGFLKGGSL